MSDYTLSYTGEEVNGLLNTVNSNHAAWDSISQVADYIVDQGTSGNWTYRKWNSGVAECWGKFDTTATETTAWGSIYQVYPEFGNISYPFEFISVPHENVMVRMEAMYTAGVEISPINTRTTTKTGKYLAMRGSSCSSGYGIEYEFYVIGKYK